MDVDAGVEEKKGEDGSTPAAAAVSAERTQKGKGEGDRNIMLHPVRPLRLPFVGALTSTVLSEFAVEGKDVGWLVHENHLLFNMCAPVLYRTSSSS